MDVCKICPEFKPSTGQCKQCGCFMRAKVLLPMQACPIGKWQMTQDNQWNTRRPNYQAFSGQYNEGAWSTEMNIYNVGGSDPGGTPGPNRSFSWPITFSNDGRQKFDTAVDDSGVCSIQGYGTQFNLGGFNAWTRRTTSDYIPAGSYIITMTTNNGGGGPWGVAADWVGYDPIPAPSLDQPSVSGLYNGYILRGTSVEVQFRVSYLDAQVSSTTGIPACAAVSIGSIEFAPPISEEIKASTF